MNKAILSSFLLKLSFGSICTRPQAREAFKQTAVSLKPSGIDLPSVICLPEFLFDGLRLSENNFPATIEQTFLFPEVVDVSPHTFATHANCDEDSMADALSCNLESIRLEFESEVTIPHGLLSAAHLPNLKEVDIDVDGLTDISESLLTGNELRITFFGFRGSNLVKHERLMNLVALLKNAEEISLQNVGLTGSDFPSNFFSGFSKINTLRLNSNSDLLCGETEAEFRSRTGLRSAATIIGSFTNSCS